MLHQGCWSLVVALSSVGSGPGVLERGEAPFDVVQMVRPQGPERRLTTWSGLYRWSAGVGGPPPEREIARTPSTSRPRKAAVHAASAVARVALATTPTH